jgi:hypothetical protein
MILENEAINPFTLASFFRFFFPPSPLLVRAYISTNSQISISAARFSGSHSPSVHGPAEKK